MRRQNSSAKLPNLDSRNRADEARRRLGVTKEQMHETLKITSRLREAGFTTERVVEILDGDTSEDSRIFLSKYRSVSVSDLAYLSIEELCVAAGITTRRLWELLSGARLEQSQDITKLIIADSMPRVVSNAVKAATEAVPIMDGQGQVQGWNYGDMKATEFLGKVSGLMPTPKGVSAVFNISPQLPIPETEPDMLPLQGMDSALKEIQQIVAEPHRLEAPKPEFIQPIEAEYEDLPMER